MFYIFLYGLNLAKETTKQILFMPIKQIIQQMLPLIFVKNVNSRVLDYI